MGADVSMVDRTGYANGAQSFEEYLARSSTKENQVLSFYQQKKKPAPTPLPFAEPLSFQRSWLSSGDGSSRAARARQDDEPMPRGFLKSFSNAFPKRLQKVACGDDRVGSSHHCNRSERAAPFPSPLPTSSPAGSSKSMTKTGFSNAEPHYRLFRETCKFFEDIATAGPTATPRDQSMTENAEQIMRPQQSLALTIPCLDRSYRPKKCCRNSERRRWSFSSLSDKLRAQTPRTRRIVPDEALAGPNVPGYLQKALLELAWDVECNNGQHVLVSLPLEDGSSIQRLVRYDMK